MTSLSAYDTQVLQHYTRWWNAPLRIQEPDSPGPICVAEFCTSQDVEPCWIYATIGASREPMPASDKEKHQVNQRFELMMYSSRERTDLASLLLGLAKYPFMHNAQIGFGHRIPGLQGVVDGSPLTDILILPAVQEPRKLRSLHIDGSHIDILWATPIYPSERLYASQHGWRKLVDLFTEAGIDSTDFQRASVV